jgi:hypothetical protein
MNQQVHCFLHVPSAPFKRGMTTNLTLIDDYVNEACSIGKSSGLAIYVTATHYKQHMSHIQHHRSSIARFSKL